jgi:hypothetical protein
MKDTFLFVLFILFGIWAAWAVENFECSSKAKVMGVEFNYGASSGCMIKKKGQYVPIENYRVTE